MPWPPNTGKCPILLGGHQQRTLLNITAQLLPPWMQAFQRRPVIFGSGMRLCYEMKGCLAEHLHGDSLKTGSCMVPKASSDEARVSGPSRLFLK